MNRIENVVFDLDGTLIDSSEGVVAAVNYSLEQMGEPHQSPELIKAYIGYPLSAMYPNFTDKPLDELYRHFQVKAAETVISSTVALPGVEKAIRLLYEQGYRLAIATTKVKRHLDGILSLLNWQDFFVVGVGGDEVDRVKPDPEAFQLTLTRMKADPRTTLVVGDTENDVLAAKAVPLPVAAIRSPYGDDIRLRATDPDYFLDHISELPDLIARLNGGDR
ncbi:MAG TPA: HAD family hydrolase [candidate division Zixibacteria bacterium]|nr:HAD family hydrolase [candidate division Zixibacteria bacterium]